MNASAILASTLGWDIREVPEYRYQRYTAPAVYLVGDCYFAVYKTKPKHSDVGADWHPHPDQFWADRAGTTVWVSQAL
jgi:hypothetical protein